MSVRSLFPIFATRDVAGLSRFYESAFGAEVNYRFEDVYVAMDVGGGHIGIGWDPDVAPGGQVSVWLYVDGVDAAYEAALAAGAVGVEGPADMPWGERVARVRDPDGNPLHLAAAAAAG